MSLTFSKKIARVLHAPLHVRNHETSGRRHFAVLNLGAEVQRQLVSRAMDLKVAVKVELRFAVRRQFPADTIRREDGFGVARAFQNFLVHALVARRRCRSSRWLHPPRSLPTRCRVAESNFTAPRFSLKVPCTV